MNRNPEKSKKRLEQVRDILLRAKHYLYRTEQTYIEGIRRYRSSIAPPLD